ncbi:MAG: trypsin-like peptidase domain-containing protein [Candidatus Omnitrophica bacterium]|nr:trypsin-like peptidase domain-containing protein [Candidatus Omnitrophota bacterium]
MVQIYLMIACFAVSALTFHAPRGEAATSVLSTLIESSKAVVEIKAEIGGFLGTKSEAFIHQESGSVMIQQGITPFYHLRTGAGVIVDPSGLIVTNKHIVSEAGRITVVLHDQAAYEAQLVYISQNHDIALLKISSPHPLPVFEMSNSELIQIDSKVYSIGNSPLLKNTISEGRISGVGVKKERAGVRDPSVQLIQIDFDLFQGDSGSPLLDAEGKLLGIMAAESTRHSKETYAVPSHLILKTIREAAETAQKQSSSS